MIKNIKKIQQDVKKKRATNAANGMQLIEKGMSLFKRGMILLLGEVFTKK